MTPQNRRERTHQTASGRPGHRASSASLLEVQPELEPLLAGEQLDQARRFVLPTRTVKSGTDVIETLTGSDAFGAIVLDGLLLQGMQISKRPTLRLLEPGDVVPFSHETPALPLATVSVRAAIRSRIVLLDGHFVAATQRFPQLVALMYRRAVESSERLATQLALSHLARVDERLMALMWLLADAWGRVTPSGIRLRLALTHDALGQLVGAQRPTVTLALKELAERGSLIRQDEDWMILDPPPEPHEVELEPPKLLHPPGPGSAWSAAAESEPQDGRLELLQAELARLRDKYAPDRELARDLQDEARQLRARTHDLVFDAHLLEDDTHDELAARASARNPPHGRLDESSP